MLEKSKIYRLLGILLFAIACSGTSEKPALEYMPDMANSPAVKAQETFMRSPVLGTNPRGFHAYPYKVEEGDLAGEALSNPYPINKEVLLRGQKSFETYCQVCHGPVAKGNGSIVPKFPQPPSLHSDKVRSWSDGRIFHVVTKGQKLMPSYSSQVTEEERWAIIHYMRALQRAVHPLAGDIQAYKQALEGQI